jgi:transcriptional regulator with XRE-family HTH domain
MTTVHGPVVGRRRLRTALRTRREAAQLTQEQVAHAMDWSLSKLIRIEAGVVSISTNDVKALLQLYEVSDPIEVSDLVEMARIARRRTWWSPYKDNVPSSYASYIGLEAETSALRYFYPVSIPGLLQTRSYATAVVEATVGIQVTQEEVPTRVDIRMVRQREVLGRPEPPEVFVILDEAVLRRVTGGPDVMREQLRHLAVTAAKPNVTIRVLPYSAGDQGLMGPFMILEFPDDHDKNAVYVEGAIVQDVIDRDDDVRRYDRAYARLWDLCLEPDESMRLIKKIAGEL